MPTVAIVLPLRPARYSRYNQLRLHFRYTPCDASVPGNEYDPARVRP